MNGRKYHQEITKVSEVLQFGRYKYQTVQHLIRTNVSYLCWLHDEGIVKFSDEVWGQIDEKAMQEAEKDLWGSDYGRDMDGHLDPY